MFSQSIDLFDNEAFFMQEPMIEEENKLYGKYVQEEPFGQDLFQLQAQELRQCSQLSNLEEQQSELIKFELYDQKQRLSIEQQNKYDNSTQKRQEQKQFKVYYNPNSRNLQVEAQPSNKLPDISNGNYFKSEPYYVKDTAYNSSANNNTQVVKINSKHSSISPEQTTNQNPNFTYHYNNCARDQQLQNSTQEYGSIGNVEHSYSHMNCDNNLHEVKSGQTFNEGSQKEDLLRTFDKKRKRNRNDEQQNQNKLAQQRYRERRKMQVVDMQEQIDLMQAKIDRAEEERDVAQADTQRLKQDLMQIEQQINQGQNAEIDNQSQGIQKIKSQDNYLKIQINDYKSIYNQLQQRTQAIASSMNENSDQGFRKGEVDTCINLYIRTLVYSIALKQSGQLKDDSNPDLNVLRKDFSGQNKIGCGGYKSTEDVSPYASIFHIDKLANQLLIIDNMDDASKIIELKNQYFCQLQTIYQDRNKIGIQSQESSQLVSGLLDQRFINLNCYGYSKTLQVVPLQQAQRLYDNYNKELALYGWFCTIFLKECFSLQQVTRVLTYDNGSPIDLLYLANVIIQRHLKVEK